MIHELDPLILTVDLPDYGLVRGDLAAAVLVHPDGSCEAEFVTLDGETLAVLTLHPTQFRPIGPREIAHVRAIEGGAFSGASAQ